ncbi:betaine/proline/choline family ABC transporter ATP-binding protein [Ammoniphilus resinae]|uniref:Quaternary amine transport ATP-binding protein n=1 Tax=Ammoniphilus resinae TaxID=861532 RepID=A0ABS4GL61_9BACL|nr:betaine/proline/choline family ABC transporter ATP-binding protein [Ammoniphilus resinae]MBP1930981.1 osmoprotectant transport system ATP-binding protein [Ammoniphilus resinae]
MIRLEGVQKVYEDGFKALKNINIEFKRGEISVLIGPSGCGKTTTMKLLNRLIEHTEGKVLIDGKDISTIDPIDLRRSIGYVIQHIGLFPHMSIKENVAAVPKLLKWDTERIEKRVTELLNMVGLDPDTYKDRRPSELSGGQQQRVGVIRALAAEPSIILMDEPFSALDPISREQLQDELVRLQKEIQKTIIFVTHDMDEAIKIADQIILMKDGEVVQQGTPVQILQNPANEFVEEFIGKERLQKYRSMPTVEEFMEKRSAIVSPDMPLPKAMKQMEEHHLDTMIVVDGYRQVKGQLSIFQMFNNNDANKLVVDVMKPVKYRVQTGTPLEDALTLMSQHDVHALPVIDKKLGCLGLITKNRMIEGMARIYSMPRKEGA